MKNPLKALLAPKEEKEEIVDEAVHPTLIEKFVLKDGRTFLIYRPRVRHTLEGRSAMGDIAKEDGEVTHTSMAVPMNLVDQHIMMGWSRRDAKLVDCPELPLESLS